MGEHRPKAGKKKKTHEVGLFFLTGLRPVLTGLRPVLPLGQCSLSKSAALHPKCLHKAHLRIVNIQISNFKVKFQTLRHWNCKCKSLKFLV